MVGYPPVVQSPTSAALTNEAIVFIHALGVDHRFWDPIAQRLDAYHVIRYDLPGHGAAPVSADPLTVEDLGAQCIEMLDQAGHQKAHLVGMSLGGTLAQYVAATYPERVLSLTAADSVAVYPDSMNDVWHGRAQTARSEGMSPLIAGLTDIWFSPEAVAADAPMVKYAQERWGNIEPEGFARACELLADIDVSQLLDRITVPSLIICGVDDLPLMKDGAQTLAKDIAGARLVWLNPGRHAAPRESEDDFVAALEELFASTRVHQSEGGRN